MISTKVSLNFCILPQRYILVLMCCLSLVISTSMGGSIVIILYQITPNTKAIKFIGNPCIRDDTIITNINIIINEIRTVKLRWSPTIQGYIHASFFWGQIITHIPSGIISDKCGGKWVLALSILFGGIISMLTPLAIIHYDAIGLIFARILLGCCNGCTTPAINSLLSRWVPFDERGRSGVIVYSGIQIGNQVGYVFPVYFIQNYKTLLPVYYFWGFFAIFWFIIFVVVCYSDPHTNPFIKPSEVEHLEYDVIDVNINRNIKIPWNEIFTSGSMKGYYVAVIGHSWCFGLLQLIIPNYYINMLRFTYEETLLRMTISNLCMMFTTIIPGFIGDWMINEKIMSVTASRKCWTTVAFIGSAIFLLCASYADCNRRTANIFFTICITLFGPWYAGMNLNALDLAPNYSGTIMGITDVIAAITFVLLTPISNTFVESNFMSKWRDFYWLTFLILCICTIYVGVAASGKVQQWNDTDYTKEEKKPNSIYRYM